ncbi:MAG: APC family permease [Firmicutes bacterium]|jgi:amino acid transporter|nr:APC family permease [Bacillota bacterium]
MAKSYGELARNHVGFWQVLFQSVSQMGPGLSAVSGLTAAASFAAGAMPLAIILALIASLFGANTLIQFAKKISSAGGYYAFVAHGSGPRMGVFTGWIYLLYQGINAPAMILFFGFLMRSVLNMGLGTSLPQWTWWPFAMLAAGFVWYISYKGIKPSLRYSMVAGLIEIVVFVILGTVLVEKAGPHNTYAAFLPQSSPTGWAGVGMAMVFGLFSFAGYGAAAPLGEEAKNPKKTISRAVFLSVLIVGIYYVFIGYASTVGWGFHNMKSYSSLPLPLMTMAQKDLGSLWFWLLAVLVMNGTLACITAIHNAQVRVLYALGRDKLVVPERLGQTHAIHRSPFRAIHFQSVINVVVVSLVGFWLGSFAGFVFLGELMTLSTLTVHIFANFSLTRYYKRLGEFRIVVHGIIPALATILYLFPIYFTIYPVPNFPDNIPPYAVVAWLVMGGLLLARIFKQSPERIQNAGLITVDTSEEITG